MTAEESIRPVVKVLDKEFELFISYNHIQERIKQIAGVMNLELAELNPVFLAVLNGAFFFAADLMKEICFPCELSFVKISSYRGMQSSGVAETLIGLDENLGGRNIVIVEDIVDTGNTMHDLTQKLEKIKPASVRIATLILKPDALQKNVPLDYIGYEVPDEFLIGYGLDYDKQGRHFKDIYKIKS